MGWIEDGLYSKGASFYHQDREEAGRGLLCRGIFLYGKKEVYSIKYILKV